MRDSFTTALELIGIIVVVVSLSLWNVVVAGVTGGLGLIALGFLLSAPTPIDEDDQ